ncbi:MAG: hypothetical protein RLN85_08270, partial [Pseudomonadales bacterium]
GYSERFRGLVSRDVCYLCLMKEASTQVAVAISEKQFYERSLPRELAGTLDHDSAITKCAAGSVDRSQRFTYGRGGRCM